MSTASKSILLRVTPQEHAEISLRATQSGQSLSRFLVSRALGDAPATWATTPQHEVTKAVEALKEALKVLEGVDISSVAIEREEAPVVEASITTPVIEPVEPVIEPVATVEDEVDDLADVVEPKVRRPRRTPEVVQITPPPGGGAPVWVQRVEKVSAHYSGSLTDPRRIFGVRVVHSDYSLPGTLYCALLGTTTLVVGQAVGGEVVWSESLSWRQADRAATLDRVKVLAKRS